MSTAATAGPAVEAVALLRVLSLALAPPTRERLAEVRALLGGLSAGGDGAPDVEELAAALRGESAETLGPAYQRLFGGSVALAPYEASYEADPFRQARQMADVAGFYRAFGADAHGPAAERPDHGGCELEFVAFLGVRRLAAADAGRVEEAEQCGEIEDAFLREHAGRWLPAFFTALARADDGVFGAVGRLGERVLRDELARRGIEPDSIGPRAGRLSVEDDELRCAAESEQVTPLLPAAARRRRRR
jgi:TorA maturation chaperone TorD